MAENTRRGLLRIAGVGAVTALAGCASAVDRLSGEVESTATDRQTRATTGRTTRRTTDRQTEAETTTEPDEPNAEPTEEPSEEIEISETDLFGDDPPLPADPGAHRYAVMGDPDSSPTATVYGNWKCPYTASFVVDQLPTLVDRFTRPGDVAIEFRSLAYLGGDPFLGEDAPRASRAGLAVWNVAPDAYWSYLGTVFANQPPERRSWAQVELLERFASEAGVDRVGAVSQLTTTDRFAPAVQKTVDRAQRRAIATVPRVVTEDRITAPTVDFEATRRQFRAVADGR